MKHNTHYWPITSKTKLNIGDWVNKGQTKIEVYSIEENGFHSSHGFIRFADAMDLKITDKFDFMVGMVSGLDDFDYLADQAQEYIKKLEMAYKLARSSACRYGNRCETECRSADRELQEADNIYYSLK